MATTLQEISVQEIRLLAACQTLRRLRRLPRMTSGSVVSIEVPIPRSSEPSQVPPDAAGAKPTQGLGTVNPR